MRIGVDTRIFFNEKIPLFRNYTILLLQQLTQQYSQYRFFTFTTDEDQTILKDIENITSICITPRSVNLVSLKLWYDVKLPLALKKYKIDVLICPNGICSLTTGVPQILLFQHFNFDKKNSSFTGLSFVRKYNSSFIKKAKNIATVSREIKDKITDEHKTELQKVIVSGLGAPDLFKPIEWEEKEAIKEQLVDGFEYFIFTAGLHPAANVINVLKAFSIFKKWQKSGMKLVIVAFDNKFLQAELDKLSTYKYRKDVIIKTDLPDEDAVKLITASYAVIHTPSSNQFISPVLEALAGSVPIIATMGNGMREVAAEGALYVNPAKPEEIAEAMKTIFKDENLRSKLIENGKLQAAKFSLAKSIQNISQLIDLAVSG